MCDWLIYMGGLPFSKAKERGVDGGKKRRGCYWDWEESWEEGETLIRLGKINYNNNN